MPIYEYQCESCGHELEVLQKMADAPLVECPQCGTPSLKKRLSAVGFRLKGSGWYETDFKQGGQRKNLHQDSGETATKGATKSAEDKGHRTSESTTAKTTAAPSPSPVETTK